MPCNPSCPKANHSRDALWSDTGNGVGVRIHQNHPPDDVHQHTFALLPDNEDPETDLTRDALVTALLNRWG